jgi:hypothetical protein
VQGADEEGKEERMQIKLRQLNKQLHDLYLHNQLLLTQE